MSVQDHARLSIFPATKDQVVEARTRSAAQWARGMTVEQFVGAYALIDQREHANEGKLITWCATLRQYSNRLKLQRLRTVIYRVLAPKDDPTTLNFVSTVET